MVWYVQPILRCRILSLKPPEIISLIPTSLGLDTMICYVLLPKTMLLTTSVRQIRNVFLWCCHRFRLFYSLAEGIHLWASRLMQKRNESRLLAVPKPTEQAWPARDRKQGDWRFHSCTLGTVTLSEVRGSFRSHIQKYHHFCFQPWWTGEHNFLFTKVTRGR